MKLKSKLPFFRFLVGPKKVIIMILFPFQLHCLPVSLKSYVANKIKGFKCYHLESIPGFSCLNPIHGVVEVREN